MNKGFYSRDLGGRKSSVLWTLTKSGFPIFACSCSVTMTVDTYGHLCNGDLSIATKILNSMGDIVVPATIKFLQRAMAGVVIVKS